MRFQRHAKIFRGQLDPAPLAGVFFLLILFVLLGNMLYTPGVLIHLQPNGNNANTQITVTRTNILFSGKSFSTNELDLLQTELAKSTSLEPLKLKSEPGASPRLQDQIEDLIRAHPRQTNSLITVTRTNILFSGKSFKPNELELLQAELATSPSSEPLKIKMESGASSKLRDQIEDLLRIDPPAATDMVGTDNEIVIVAVNLRSQFFLENQMIQEDALREYLKKQLEKTWLNSKDLTLVLMEDKGVPFSTTVQICKLAKEVGIKEVLLFTREVFSPRAASRP